MAYEESDEDWAQGQPGSGAGGKSSRDKTLNEMKQRMGNKQSNPRDEELFNKWAADVDAGSASPGSTEFVNAMKNEGHWKPMDETGGPWVPATDYDPALPECETKDCLGMCDGPNTADEHGGCCKDEDRDCAGKCYGASITVQQGNATICCDRTDPDSAAYCCKNPVDNCNPACPQPGQIINAHSSSSGCWCTPDNKNCCTEARIDRYGKCPFDPQYHVWVHSTGADDACTCTEVLFSTTGAEGGYASKDTCENACPKKAFDCTFNLSYKRVSSDGNITDMGPLPLTLNSSQSKTVITHTFLSEDVKTFTVKDAVLEDDNGATYSLGLTNLQWYDNPSSANIQYLGTYDFLAPELSDFCTL